MVRKLTLSALIGSNIIYVHKLAHSEFCMKIMQTSLKYDK